MTTPAIRIPPSAGEVLRFAAAELQGHLARALVADPPLAEDDRLPANSLFFGAGAVDAIPAAPQSATDAFRIQPLTGGFAVRGETERAALHGVYALLEQLGFRWPLHRCDAERGPGPKDALPALAAATCSPAFRVRGYVSDIMTWHYNDPARLAIRAAEDRTFLDWVARSGGNALFLIQHPFDTHFTLPHLVPECRRRGIDLEYGGHVIPRLVPRELFTEHPEYFPVLAAGRRSDCGNLCASSNGALELAAANALDHVETDPELSALHIWGADLWGGGWCRCAECARLSPQDQSLTVCNAVATRLDEAGRARDVCYLAYHDTIEPLLAVRPAPHVVAEFAPRERCYGHALNDPACETNARYGSALERYVELFDGHVRLFEYYGDAILFCGCAAPLAEIIEADLTYARALGIREVTLLQFGAFSQWAYALNHFAFAAATRQPTGAGARAYLSRFGALDRHMARLHHRLGVVMRSVLTYGDVRRPPRDAARTATLLPAVARAVRDLGEIAEHLQNAGDARAHEEAQLVAYTRLVLEGVRSEMATQGPEGRAAAAEHYAAAEALMQEVDPAVKGLWGAVDLPFLHRVHDSGGFGPPGDSS